MSSSTDKISLQENRIGDSSTVEATDTDAEVADISDAVVEFLERRNLLALAVLHLFPNRQILTGKPSSADSALSRAGVFDPMAVFTAEQTLAPTSAAKGEDKLDSSEFVPSIF